MKVLVWIGVALLLLILLLVLLRLRLTGIYGAEGASLTVSLGSLPILKIPRPKGQKDAGGPGRPEKKKKKKKEEKKEESKGGSEPGFRRELQIISRLLGKLKRRLCIDEMTLWYQSAGDDPAATALIYGAASAAAAALARAVESMFRVRERDVRASVSFTESKPRVFARLRLSVSLGLLLWFVAKAALERKRARIAAGSK